LAHMDKEPRAIHPAQGDAGDCPLGEPQGQKGGPSPTHLSVILWMSTNWAEVSTSDRRFCPGYDRRQQHDAGGWVGGGPVAGGWRGARWLVFRVRGVGAWGR